MQLKCWIGYGRPPVVEYETTVGESHGLGLAAVDGHAVTPAIAGRRRPAGEFVGGRGVGALSLLCAADQFGEQTALLTVTDDRQARVFRNRGRGKLGHQHWRQWPPGECPAVGMPLRYRVEQQFLFPIRPAAASPVNLCEQARLVRIGQHPDIGCEAQVPHGQVQIEQRGTATDHKLPAARIGTRQITGEVCVQADAVVPADEVPRLSVVH